MPTFNYVATEYLEHCGQRDLEPATMKSYAYLIDRFLRPDLGERMVTDLVRQDFEKLYQRMKEGNYVVKTITKLHGHAKRVMDFARREGWVRENVARDAELPRSGRTDDLPIPTAGEVALLLSNAAKRDRGVYDYARFIVQTGMKPGEVCALRRSDLDGLVLNVSRSVDVSNGPARAKESISPRRVRVDERIANFVLDRDEWTFGGTMPARSDLLSKKFKRVALRAGLGHITPKNLRDFHAVTLLRSNKMAVAQVSNVLGYRSPQTMLARYGICVDAGDGIAPDIIRYELRQSLNGDDPTDLPDR